jgi:hypothetical protein
VVFIRKKSLGGEGVLDEQFPNRSSPAISCNLNRSGRGGPKNSYNLFSASRETGRLYRSRIHLLWSIQNRIIREIRNQYQTGKWNDRNRERTPSQGSIPKGPAAILCDLTMGNESKHTGELKWKRNDRNEM